MRLWHKDLISVLPRQQLLGQIREVTLIMKNILVLGKPNHILVNEIMNYNMSHFYNYCELLKEEMNKRNYKISDRTLLKWSTFFSQYKIKKIEFSDIFESWHEKLYLKMCYYNLLEKFMCGGIKAEEFEKIRKKIMFLGGI